MTKQEICEHWSDMPEFVQEKKVEYQKIIVRFDSEEDVQDFAEAIDQVITPKTKSIWYPKLDRFKNKGVYYGD